MPSFINFWISITELTAIGIIPWVRHLFPKITASHIHSHFWPARFRELISRSIMDVYPWWQALFCPVWYRCPDIPWSTAAILDRNCLEEAIVVFYLFSANVCGASEVAWFWNWASKTFCSFGPLKLWCTVEPLMNRVPVAFLIVQAIRPPLSFRYVFLFALFDVIGFTSLPAPETFALCVFGGFAWAHPANSTSSLAVSMPNCCSGNLIDR